MITTGHAPGYTPRSLNGERRSAFPGSKPLSLAISGEALYFDSPVTTTSSATSALQSTNTCMHVMAASKRNERHGFASLLGGTRPNHVAKRCARVIRYWSWGQWPPNHSLGGLGRLLSFWSCMPRVLLYSIGNSHRQIISLQGTKIRTLRNPLGPPSVTLSLWRVMNALANQQKSNLKSEISRTKNTIWIPEATFLNQMQNTVKAKTLTNGNRTGGRITIGNLMTLTVFDSCGRFETGIAISE